MISVSEIKLLEFKVYDSVVSIALEALLVLRFRDSLRMSTRFSHRRLRKKYIRTIVIEML